MSLINDALKTAQRERDGRKAGEATPAVGEAFFPYAQAAEPVEARRTPTVMVGILAVALVAATALWMWPARTDGPPTPARSPIVLPPRVSVAPPSSVRPETSMVAATGAGVPVSTDASLGAANQASQPPRGSHEAARDSRPVIEPTVSASVSGARSAVEPVEVVRVPAAGPRVDYEAEATALFNAGDLVGARERFLLATRNAPSARAWTNYGVTLQRLGDNVGAAAAYQSAIGVDANYLEGWLYRGRLAAEMGDTRAAVPMLERARVINPRNAEVNVELARLEYEAGDHSQSRRFAADALRSDPTNARAQWYLAVSSDQLKDTDAAIQAYGAFIQYAADVSGDQARFIGYARTRIAELRARP